MIHTFEIVHITNKDKITEILRGYYEKQEIAVLLSRFIDGEKANVPVRIPGVVRVTISIIGLDLYMVRLRVDPQAILVGRRTITLFDCSFDSLATLRRALNNGIKQISHTLPNSEDWKVSRIDYTMNISTPYVKEQVKLAKKGKIPYGYEKNTDEPGSIYLESKSVTLNFYDKLDQISKQVDKTSYEEYLLEEARNIYRIEVQIHSKEKLKQIRKSFKLRPGANLYDYLSHRIAKSILRYHYNTVVGIGDYYSLNEALKIVENINWRRDRKESTNSILKLISQTRSITRAKELFMQGTTLKNTKIIVQGGASTFSKFESDLRNLGMNPITIPKHWKVKYIPNPFQQLSL